MKTSPRFNVNSVAICGLIASVVVLVLLQPWDPAVTVGPLNLRPQPKEEASFLETEAYTRQSITFDCSGEKCHAWLYMPKQIEGAVSFVILGHGVGLSKGFGLHQPASYFAEAGFAALAFDYRTWGSSSGKYRQILSPPRNIEDWKSAITYVQSLNASHIFLRGASYSGGQVLELAASSSSNIAGVIALAPVVNTWDPTIASFQYRPHTIRLRQLAAFVQDTLRQWVGMQPLYIPILGPIDSVALGGILQPDVDGYLAMVPAEYQGTWQNLMRASYLFDNFLMSPLYRAHKIKCPVLIQAAKDDMILPLVLAEETAAKVPQGRLEVYPGGHFDVVHNTPQTILKAQLRFLRQHAQPTTAASLA